MRYFDKIKDLVQSRGISLEDVTTGTGISINTIKKWNKVEPSISSLQLVAQFFDISVDYLIEYTNNPQSHKSDLSKTIEVLEEIRTDVDMKIEVLKALERGETSPSRIP